MVRSYVTFSYIFLCESLSLWKEDECVIYSTETGGGMGEQQQVCELIAGPFFRLSVSGENVHRVM